MSAQRELNRFTEEVLDIMPLMVREFAKREDNPFTRGAISCPQMLALHFLAQNREVTVSEIARLLNVRNSSASTLLDRMIRQKLMTRRHDKEDRRVVWVAITPKGRQVISQILEQKRRSIKAIFGPLTQTERSQYLSVLGKVSTHLAGTCALIMVLLLSHISAAEAFWPFSNHDGKKTQERVVTAAEASLAEELTLQEAFQKALKRSESVAITAEEMNQAQARFYRSFDYFLPTVSFQMTRQYQDASGEGGSIGNFGRPNTPEKKFVFSQPLFSGFKEIAAIRGTGADKKQQRFAWLRAKELLFVDVTEAYYTLLNTKADVQVMVEIHQRLTERLKDLRERMDVGRSRKSEYKSSLVDVKTLEADLVEAKRRVKAAKNLLEFYLGESLDSYKLSDSNGEELDGTADIEHAQKRFDVMSSEQAYLVAQNAVVAANADLFPKISLNGDYYTQRVGFMNGNDWDVLLTFDVPVFEAGQTLGDIKEAASSREKARLAYDQIKRTARLEAKDAWDDLKSAQDAEEVLKSAHQASKENYEILQSEFESNLVNNLEVLDALRRYLEVERRYQESRFTTKKYYWKLRVTLGDIPGVNP